MTDLPEPYRHRIALPAGAEAVVRVGDEVAVGDVVARTIRAAGTQTVPIARPLRRRRSDAAELMLVPAGSRVRVDQPLARTPDREVRSPTDAIVLGYRASNGAVRLLPLAASDSLTSEVHGIVMEVEARAITISLPAAALDAVAGTGPAVSGPITMLVGDGQAALEPGLIGADAAGRIVVGGSFASAEAITRARAVGVAGIVVGGIHARELAEFAGLQHRRSLLGTAAPPFAVLAVEGFGRTSMEPTRFAWLAAHAGHSATILGDRRRLLVYDATPPPVRAARPAVGDRVLIVAGPGRGQTGLLAENPSQPIAIGSGISALCGLVRLESGRTVAAPLANLETVLPLP